MNRTNERVENAEVKRLRDKAELCLHKGEEGDETDDDYSGLCRELLSTRRIICGHTLGIVSSNCNMKQRK